MTGRPSPQLAREKPDPWESAHPLPILFLIFFAGVAGIGVAYLARQLGPGLALGGDQRSPQRVVAAELTGEGTYQKICAACHQGNGLGVDGAFPPLAGSPWLLADRDTPIRIVLLGLSGPIEVAGKHYAGVMPAFKDTLSDREIALAISHARSSFGNQAAAVSAEDVAKVRASLAGRAESWAGGAALEEARKTPILPELP